ncbi:MAG: hypothetical protein AAF447_06655 [Myxococcota bacterium]
MQLRVCQDNIGYGEVSSRLGSSLDRYRAHALAEAQVDLPTEQSEPEIIIHSVLRWDGGAATAAQLLATPSYQERLDVYHDDLPFLSRPGARSNPEGPDNAAPPIGN